MKNEQIKENTLLYFVGTGNRYRVSSIDRSKNQFYVEALDGGRFPGCSPIYGPWFLDWMEDLMIPHFNVTILPWCELCGREPVSSECSVCPSCFEETVELQKLERQGII